jgi:hypothetical protein
MAWGVREEPAIAGASVALRERAANFSIHPSLDPFPDASEPPGREPSRPFPEIDCLRGRFHADLIAYAEQRAASVGVSADRVLIAAGVIDEEAYLRALADSLGLTFDALDGISRAQCPIDDGRLIKSAAAGMLPLSVNGELCLAVAPRGLAVRRIIKLISDKPKLARCIRFTSTKRLTDFVFHHGSRAIAARATKELKSLRPDLSAAPPRWRANIASLAVFSFIALMAILIAPAQTMLAVEIMLSGLFLAWLGLRLAGAFIAWPAAGPQLALRDDELPIYTIISALYREASSVGGLLAAIERIDYPGIMAQTPQ